MACAGISYSIFFKSKLSYRPNFKCHAKQKNNNGNPLTCKLRIRLLEIVVSQLDLNTI